MGQKPSKQTKLTIRDRVVLLFFIDHAIDELEKDMRETDAMFRRLVAGLDKVNVARVGPEHVRRTCVQRRGRVQYVPVRAAMQDVAALDLAEEDEKGIG